MSSLRTLLPLAGLALLLSTPGPATAEVPAAYFTAARDDAAAQPPAPADSDQADLTSVPWFERVQLRAAVDDSDQSRRSLAARLNLKTPGQYRAEKEILSLRAHRNATTARAEFSRALQQRYQLLIDLHHRQQQQRLADARQQLAQRRVDALRATAGSSEFRPAALQQAELRLTDTRRQAQLAERRLQHARQQVDARLPTGHGAHTASAGHIEPPALLTVDELSALTAGGGGSGSGSDSGSGSNGSNDPRRSAELDLALLDTRIAQQELERERGRSGLGLRFLELRHLRERDIPGGDNRLTIGIDLPIGRSFASSERHLQHNEAIYRMHRLQRAQTRQSDQFDAELALLLDEYRIQRGRLDDIDQRLARHRRGTPVDLTLELERERLDTRERLTGLQTDIYQRYVDLLQLRGLLAAEPLRNWLAAGQPPL